MGVTVKSAREVELGDGDGDGERDLVAGNDSEANRVYLGNGNGTFAAGSDVDAAANFTRSVKLGDLDGDGLLGYEVVGEVTPCDPTLQLLANAAPQAGIPRRGSRSSKPGGNEARDATMQRVQIDVFLASDLELSDEEAFPLASRTAFVLETTTIKMLAPAGDLETPSEDDEGESESDDFEAARNLGLEAPL